VTQWQRAARNQPGGYLVGLHETPQAQLRTFTDPVSANAMAIARAVRDADLDVHSIDMVLTYDSLVAPDILQANRVAEYLGVSTKISALVGAAGASPATALAVADSFIRDGQAETVAIAHSDLRSAAGRDKVIAIMAGNVGNPEFEAPYGPIIPTMYSLLADWLVGLGHASPEDFADIAVATRRWAALNPLAARTEPLTREDVLTAPRVAGLLGKLDCCLVTDFSGAVIVSAHPPAAAGRRPVRVRAVASANSHEEISQVDPDGPLAAVERAAAEVYERAAVSAEDVDAAFLYDSFTSTTAQQLISYGLTRQRPLSWLLGEFGIGPGGGLPVNTHGGLLSASTSGLFHLIEAVRQLRGDAGDRQIDEPSLALVTNLGGLFSGHCAAILEAVR
jgi:hypothetical protein